MASIIPFTTSAVQFASKYEKIGLVGGGIHGIVYQAKEICGGGLYAIKSPLVNQQLPTTASEIEAGEEKTNSEVAICHYLRAKRIPNIVPLVEAFRDSSHNMPSAIVFEYAAYDLRQIVNQHGTQYGGPLSPRMIQSVMYQLLHGLRFIHEAGVIHRDLKEDNIMITSSGLVQIGDFGCAKKISDPAASLRAWKNHIVALRYRAPELLLGADEYTTAIDIWTAGCLYAFLLTAGGTIFDGNKYVKPDVDTLAETTQLEAIMNILGMPDKEIWAGVKYLTWYVWMSSTQHDKIRTREADGTPPVETQKEEGISEETEESSIGKKNRKSVRRSVRSVIEKIKRTEKKKNRSAWYGSTLRDWFDAQETATADWGSGGQQEDHKLDENMPLGALVPQPRGPPAYCLLEGLLRYDPAKRWGAREALEIFTSINHISETNCFEGLEQTYAHRSIKQIEEEMPNAITIGTSCHF